ncbi:nuclear pore complex protein Nup50 isoform X1 [Hippoglossus hippoglossus]|uniref:nuclear pore complex protein Nup50 isoform X1 n=1 Tax=Hippoglossus hippoglossus TaxID=8267 RepID=UPI00148B4455|nr:nuclear pore complex protein Nup50 isoform X1 [Hippoglossus hippoglossus]XP_034434519.1 nuclear pore complex protein Nup50 isoform X1 [Hippoglossus hippoglossus]XP_035003533.1 nuclear pore complex protein Nup50 isoform X2 [Hippoglossus stenolepis]XP_035003534.1 nuclear pore complex protein Nup50 isoform X2 [Hippoglossus stenolepis]XP_035003535.1 nuclear pore complex protein Nup50 isoform X2 [Hippoglossus stenolepis]
MAKRIADKELTDRNWDQEEEGEEAGQFSIASEDVLKSRVVKRAKRRNVGAEGENSGAFKGFKGFSLTKPAASTASPSTMFSGFGNGGGFQGLGGLTNGNSIGPSFGGFSSPAASTVTPGLTFNSPSSAKPFAEITAKQTNGSSPSPAPSFGSISGISSGSGVGNKEYSRQLTALNCSVRDWITKHVNDNPLCDLNPIFRDYERHLASIERQYGAGSAAAADGGSEEKKQAGTTSSTPPPPSSSSSSSPAAPAPAAATLFSFAKKPTDDSTQDKSSTTAPIPAGITFNFGKKVDSSVLGSLGSKSMSPSFSFSSSSSASSSQTSMFGAPGSAAPLSFSGTKAEDAPPAVENGEEESEEPPKPDIKEVKEEDAFFSKKCKMFYKKDSEFKEKGVGTLHLKQVEDGKTQMVIRADTNLGNILLNIMVSASMPCSRVGKNNVMVVCVPNPIIDDKNPTCPIPLLIRVKTAEEADELHKTLEEKKG